jgi:phosphoenolpyruvate---glycerone phosphotransferase subunit DhaK
MQKLINDPERFVDEMLDGLVLAHPERVRQLRVEPRAVVRADADFEGRVTIATGGGAGHLPLFVGYVGAGLADGCAVGNLFASPSADQMLQVTKGIDGGQGVLYLYGNYGGDRLNFDLAAELAGAEGIRVESIRFADDVASAPAERASQRRGIVGIFFGYKIAGACAASGADLDTVAGIAAKVLEQTRSIGVALSACTLPTVGHPNFEVPAGEMEIGMGIHGEPGVSRGPLQPADIVAEEMVGRILDDLDPPAGSSLAVLINGLGATPPEELLILNARVHGLLTERGHTVHRSFVGEFATSLEMAGASISVLQLDAELKRYLDAPADAPLTMLV